MQHILEVFLTMDKDKSIAPETAERIKAMAEQSKREYPETDYQHTNDR